MSLILWGFLSLVANLHNLSIHSIYDGKNVIAIESGNKLQITHIGLTNLTTSSNSFLLSNVLCVPQRKRNLI